MTRTGQTLPVWRQASGYGSCRVPPELTQALDLGLIGHVDVVVVAPSKAAASRALAVLGLDIPARQIEPAMGNNVNALRTAGFLDAPAAYVMPASRWHNVPVVAHDGTGPVLVAVIDEKPGPGGNYRPVPVAVPVVPADRLPGRRPRAPAGPAARLTMRVRAG